MTTTASSHVEPSESWSGEKFSEPRTMPAHWNLSELTSPAKPSGSGRPTESDRAAMEACSTEDIAHADPEFHEAGEASPEWQRFPEPKTFPSGWDLAW